MQVGKFQALKATTNFVPHFCFRQRVLSLPTLLHVTMLTLTLLFMLGACQISENRFNSDSKPCADGEYQHIESNIGSSDLQGHGPDIGSDEWHSVVEFKLGLRGEADVPIRGTKRWCEYIWQKYNSLAASKPAD
jgi:hypothetical protein